MKRIKINGKAQSKYDIARMLEAIDYTCHACLIYEAFTYQEMVDWLRNKIDRYNYKPLKGIIDWGEW